MNVSDIRGETSKAICRSSRRCDIITWYASGYGIDVGGGYDPLPGARLIEASDYVDGRLPFQDGALDFVYSSHMLEHVENPVDHLREWFRVLAPHNCGRYGGHLVIMVPHQHLYERRVEMPSRWNAQHRYFYTPMKLLQLVEWAFRPNTYRIRSLRDNDDGYDYGVPLDQHPQGCYEIELVIQKIAEPSWQLE